MNKTFTNTEMLPGQNVFANVEKPDQSLRIGATRTNATRNGVKASLVRSHVVLTTPLSLTKANCSDACAPEGDFTRSVRLEFSSPTSSKADLLADLKMLTGYLETSSDKLFEGFIPPASQDIVLVSAV